MTRVLVPKKLREALLRRNAKACCVCKARNVGLNFHHIDGDSANTVETNLAVVCVRDHDAHHRPEEYRPDAEMNHSDLDAATIATAKLEWEAFVAEAAKEAPAILATVTGYGNIESVHAMQLAFQWADGRLVFERVYHLLDGPPAKWADWAVAEVASFGPAIKIVLIDRPMPVEHCPSCARGMTTTLPPGFARRLASRTWASSSVCSIYVNPRRASLAVMIHDDHGEAFVAFLHRCGLFLDLATSTYLLAAELRS
jgi:hypothetical protein